MKDLLLILAHLLTTLAKLLGPGGAKAIVADSLLMKQQLLIINRSRRRAPNLTPVDRMLLGFWSLFLSSHHIQRAVVILKPTTLFKFHDILKKRKYRLLYTAHNKGKPGPKGSSKELIDRIRGFYTRLERIDRRATNETKKLISRIVRYRESLFTFLEFDGIPWHNNASELGLRHIAIQRKISNTVFQIDSIHGYLTLLGIYQTCRANGCSFLNFLLSGERDLVAYVNGQKRGHAKKRRG